MTFPPAGCTLQRFGTRHRLEVETLRNVGTCPRSEGGDVAKRRNESPAVGMLLATCCNDASAGGVRVAKRRNVREAGGGAVARGGRWIQAVDASAPSPRAASRRKQALWSGNSLSIRPSCFMSRSTVRPYILGSLDGREVYVLNACES